MGEKQALIPRLRFPEFRDAGEWDSDPVKSLVTPVTPPKKLTSDQYEVEGRFPVIDQSQNYICGWTNDEDALIPAKSPLIVFGDHTCALKIISQSFAQGADGIKILKSRDKVEPEFLYQYLLFAPVKMESYKRHFSTLKEKLVVYPDKNTGEQKKIADCLSSLDELIAAQSEKIDALKMHKIGLMQQLFPREGETLPRLRFPEFRDAGEWGEVKLSTQIELISGMHLAPSEYASSGDIPYFTGPSDYTNNSALVHKWTNKSANVARNGDTLVTVKGSGVGELLLLHLSEVAMGRQLMAVRAKAAHGQFIYHILSMKRQQMMALASGNLIPGLSRGDILGLAISVPGIKEQQRIADCLSSLDALIAAHIEKLDALKTHKKGLMQRLFPSQEAVGV